MAVIRNQRERWLWWWYRLWTENAQEFTEEKLRKQTSTTRAATSVQRTVSEKYLSKWRGDYAHMNSLTHTISGHINFLRNSWRSQLGAKEVGRSCVN